MYHTAAELRDRSIRVRSLKACASRWRWTMRIRYSAGLALLLAGACSTDPNQTAITSGSSRVLLTDDPFPYSRVARVDLYVVSISGSLNADTSASAGGDFITLAAPHRLINVLALQNGMT